MKKLLKDFRAATPAWRDPYLQFFLFGRVLFPEALPEYLPVSPL